LGIEAALRDRVIGQDHAIAALAQCIKTAMSGLSDPSRPYGVFMFLGPTGVGKTELAKGLAEFLFDDEDRLIRFDMSEFMEAHSVSKLIGAPPGYVGHDEGGVLTEAVRRNPYSVLLFDEVEKAHPRVADIFLQLFDDGRLTDSHGRLADFRHTVIILTSNLPRPNARKAIPGFHAAADQTESNGFADALEPDELLELLRTRFRPELVNRFDRVIQFHRLGPAQIRQIIDKIIARVRQRIAGKRVELHLSPQAIDRLMALGYRPDLGAREMERVIDRHIVQPLAQGLIAGEFMVGATVFVEVRDEEISLTADAPARKRPASLNTGEVLLTTLRPAAREEVTMLLFDVVRSTDIVKNQGDTFMMMRMREIQETIRRHRTHYLIRFMKFTGDGFLVLFDSVPAAIELAQGLRLSVRASDLDLRFVIHRGAVRVQDDGDPIGAEVHRLFRIEALKPEDGVTSIEGRSLPTQHRIVITPNAVDQLREPDRAQFEPIGDFTLKGFDDPQPIWAERADSDALLDLPHL
jgi:class 3 adenylate cyclase